MPNGQLWLGTGHVEDLNINIGSLQTSGYDLSVAYSGIEMGRFGELNVNVTATFLDELITEPGPGIEPYDCVGFFADDCLAPTPELRSHTRLGWESPWNVDLSLTWRYMTRSRSSAAIRSRSTTSCLTRTTSTCRPTGR